MNNIVGACIMVISGVTLGRLANKCLSYHEQRCEELEKRIFDNIVNTNDKYIIKHINTNDLKTLVTVNEHNDWMRSDNNYYYFNFPAFFKKLNPIVKFIYGRVDITRYQFKNLDQMVFENAMFSRTQQLNMNFNDMVDYLQQKYGYNCHLNPLHATNVNVIEQTISVTDDLYFYGYNHNNKFMIESMGTNPKRLIRTIVSSTWVDLIMLFFNISGVLLISGGIFKFLCIAQKQ